MPGNHTLMVCSKTYSYKKSVKGIPWGGGGTGLPLPRSCTLRRQDLSCRTPGTELVASGDGKGRAPPHSLPPHGFQSP